MSATDPHQVFHRTIEAVWRIESALVIAGLTRLTRDLDLAEDLAQEALVAALEQWPQSGVPDNPAAWLTATAKRRAIDLFRRNAVAERKHEELARELEALEHTGRAAVIYFIFAHGFRMNELFIRRSRDDAPTSTSNGPGSVTQSFFVVL